MNKKITCQGRKITTSDIFFIKQIMEKNPCWKRSKISQELCKQWNWYTSYGQMKDMAARSMLLKLHRAKLIKLPPSQLPDINSNRVKATINEKHDKSLIETTLKHLTPLSIISIKQEKHLRLFKTFLQNYHYLGFKTIVGENIKYMVFDKNMRPLACLLFGASAWKIAPRDNYISWTKKERETNLDLIAGNHRYLILPWVRVPHLASHVLGKIAKRLSADWIEKYAHPIYLLESFIQKDRFSGTCYKAANWVNVGDTQGRGKKDSTREKNLPVKSIWLYPLSKDFKGLLKTKRGCVCKNQRQ